MRSFLKEGFLFGFLLWLIGYVLSVFLFGIMPVAYIGWVILPIGMVLTIWVLLRKIRNRSIAYYAGVAAVWTLIAVAFDYLFIVKLFSPPDGYYKFDVYLYYCLTLVLPLIVGGLKTSRAIPFE